MPTPPCCICIDKTRDTFTTEKCKHSFCNKCILQWMTQNDDCPLCRTAISAPSKNKTKFEDDDIENEFKLYLDGNIYHKELNLVHERVEDFICSFEDAESYSKYNWKDNANGSYLVVRNGDYFIDLCFKIHTQKDHTNCYIIMVKVSKRQRVTHKFNHKKISIIKSHKSYKSYKSHKSHKQRTKTYLCK